MFVTHIHRHQRNGFDRKLPHTSNRNNEMFLTERSVAHHNHYRQKDLIETHLHTTHTTNNDKILTEHQSHTINNNEMILIEGHSHTTTTPPITKVFWQKFIHHQRNVFDKRSLIHINNNENFLTKVQSHITTSERILIEDELHSTTNNHEMFFTEVQTHITNNTNEMIMYV